ncbi:MAG TPA: FAD-dependent oxidoreductase [Longimicrobiales bacterium]
MALTFDVAVIGGGISGVSAALAARKRDARVCLIRTAPGATALCSGAWNGPLRAELREPLRAAGLSLLPAERPLAHERGHTVRADFAGASHGNVAWDDVTVVGIAGLPHFNAPTLARMWRPDAPLRAHTLELSGTPAAGWSAPSLAAYIERAPAPLIEQLETAGIRAALLPAILGIERVGDVLDQLASAGIQASEALGATPSIPGWRLQRAMDTLVEEARVVVLNGSAFLRAAHGRRVEQIAVGEETVTARNVVLATGKYLGGGIQANDEFRETVLGLPVWLEQLGDLFTSPDALTLTDPVRTADQPLMSAGVHVNDEQKPVDRARDVVYDNVFVAGTVRADWTAAGRGLGHCAEDGWLAGERASA